MIETMSLGVSIVSGATATTLALIALAGWNNWIALRRHELARGDEMPASPAGERITVADLKERVRRLEAIAAGVEL